MLNQNILITGASGNLGRATIGHLLKLTSAERVKALVTSQITSMNNSFSQIALHHWNSYNKRAAKTLEQLTDSKFNTEILPGGNTPSWILGHLAATHDHLFPLFGLGDLRYPELQEMYVHNHAHPQKTPFSKEELLKVWKDIDGQLDKVLSAYTAEQWLQPHTSVSEEDFAIEPHRNKLNALGSDCTCVQTLIQLNKE
jgi:uncharacterized damage-inducible protein DinB